MAKVSQSHDWADVDSLTQLGGAFAKDLTRFFETYNQLRDRTSKTRLLGDRKGRIGFASRCVEEITRRSQSGASPIFRLLLEAVRAPAKQHADDRKKYPQQEGAHEERAFGSRFPRDRAEQKDTASRGQIARAL